jgi:hydrogenase expression/formation protein HypE
MREPSRDADPARGGLQPGCPVPLRDHALVMLGHGGGGVLSAELIDDVFLRAFGNAVLDRRGDACVLDLADDLRAGGRLACTTDGYVVRPLFFPGGTIGDLAVNGTVNDLAMSGAVPRYLTVGFILEEGFPIAELRRIAASLAAAAERAGVLVVAGDTKVVERGHGDGCYVTTSGLGVVPPGIELAPDRCRPGDVVLVSGSLGDHGMAILAARDGFAFEPEITSDTAAVHGLVAAMLAACPQIRVLRDPTRGGVAASLNELAAAGGFGIEIDEHTIPVRPAVAAACRMLGLDPLLVANEGKLVAVVPAADVATVLATMRRHEHGREAVELGRVVTDPAGLVVVRTAIGGRRVLPLPLGEQLPRIC